MLWILGFVVVYVVASAWDVARVNGLFATFVSQDRSSDEHAGQPEWLVRRLEQLAEGQQRP